MDHKNLLGCKYFKLIINFFKSLNKKRFLLPIPEWWFCAGVEEEENAGQHVDDDDIKDCLLYIYYLKGTLSQELLPLVTEFYAMNQPHLVSCFTEICKKRYQINPGKLFSPLIYVLYVSNWHCTLTNKSIIYSVNILEHLKGWLKWTKMFYKCWLSSYKRGGQANITCWILCRCHNKNNKTYSSSKFIILYVCFHYEYRTVSEWDFESL